MRNSCSSCAKPEGEDCRARTEVGMLVSWAARDGLGTRAEEREEMLEAMAEL